MTDEQQTEIAEKFNDFFDGPDYFDVLDRQISQEVAAYNPVGGDNEKACANCQWYIARDNSCVVVQGHPQPIVSNGISNQWRAVVVPSDDDFVVPVRIVGESEITEGIKITADKAVKIEGGIEFNASDFAVVPDTDNPSGWKLRLAEDSPGNFTEAQVGRAITSMQPGGFRGKKEWITSEQKSQAVSRIGRAITRVDGSDEAKDNLRERLDTVKEITIKNDVMKKVKAAYHAIIDKVTPDTSVETPIDMNVITFQKDKSGALRWVATFSNNFRDRDNPPEVFTDAAHKEFVSYIDKGGEMPELWLWHTPGTAMGQADWVDYANGFITATGSIYEGHEKEALILAEMKEQGLSHGYHYIPGKDGAIDWYRTFEISVLPNQKAANPWLDFAMIESEVKDMKFNDEKREYLVGVLGEEKVATLEADQEGRAKFLTDLGVDSKEFEDGETEGDPVTGNVDVAVKLGASDLANLLTEIKESLKGFGDRIDTVEKTVSEVNTSVKTLGESEDSKVHRAFQSAFNPENAPGKPASQSKGNVVGEEEDKKHVGDIDFFGGLVEQVETQMGVSVE